MLYIHRNDIQENIEYQSHGFHLILQFLIQTTIENSLNFGDIVTIDNFGDLLNCGIKYIITFLRKIARERGVTFVLATQNPMAIDVRHLDEVRLIIRHDNGVSTITNNFDRASYGSHDTIKPLLDALTIGRNYMRTDDRKTVFVEGITDYFYLNSMCEILRSKEEGDYKNLDIDFIPINGLGYIDHDKDPNKKVAMETLAA
ncbi:MAG: hypothetical protein MJY54_01295 [archaeon]|nr:hypothetical protein [archaeon]